MKFDQLHSLAFHEENQIATITLQTPFSNMKMIQELTQICDYLEDESDCDIVVLKGQSDCFNKGLDFAEFQPQKTMDIHGFHKWEKICVRIERLPKVTIAVLQGDVIGGGFQLALCCDIRIAHPNTFFALPEVKMGFLPGMAVYRLAKQIGLGQAKRLILSGRTINGMAALEGKIVEIVTEDLEQSLAEEIAVLQPVNTVAVQLARRLLNESFEDSFEDAIGHFLAAQQRAISQDCFHQTLAQKSSTQNPPAS